MTRVARSPAAAKKTAAPAQLPPVVEDLLALSGPAFAKRLRQEVSKEGVLKAAPHATWRLLASALAAGNKAADAIAAAALRIVPDAEPDADFRNALAGWLRAAVRKPWRTPASERFGSAATAPGKPPNECGLHDAEARFASLLGNWSAGAAAVSLDYRAAEAQLCCRIAGQDVLAGSWTTAAARDGVALAPTGPWEYLCWHADEDGCYFEATLPLDGGAAIDRQIFVARHAPWVFLADTVKGPPAEQWALSWRIPAAAGLTGRGGLNNRAHRVAGAAAPLDAVPLWLPQNPLDRGAGTLRLANGELRAETAGRGAATTLAFAFRWAPDGELAPAWWKALNITHDRQPVRPDQAYAFRIEAGGKQCVAFRTLTPDFRTAFMSHQTFDECFIGWLNPAARELQAWMRIE